MKFYVAGKWVDRERVRELYEWLIRHGHSITVDWTNHERPDALDVLRHYAYNDIWGATRCDVLIALLDKPYAFKGLWVEVGAALGADKEVWIVGREGDSCIFLHHEGVKHLFESVEQLKFFLAMEEYTPAVI